MLGVYKDKNGKEIKDGMALMFFNSKELVFQTMETMAGNLYIEMNNKKYLLSSGLNFKQIEIVGGY